MKQKTGFLLAAVLAIIIVLNCVGCSNLRGGENLLPDLLRNQIFIYDELENNSGISIYTLRFNDSGYYLYKDNGTGIISDGKADVNTDKSISFSDDKNISNASYTGSSFEEPSVTLTYNNTEMRFTPATETTEYVYLSYLGTFTGEINGKEAVLVLDRWFEWYLYTNGSLTKGIYEIFDDSTITLQTSAGKKYKGTVNKGNAEEFDIRNISFDLKIKGKKINFEYASANEKYDAAHAMGTYTLSLYSADVFEIHGIDGYLKAIGTLKDNEVIYFPREITNNIESEERYKFTVTSEEDIYYFPETTPLLPRSGNIDDETGYGIYWTAGTKLEFIKQSNKLNDVSATELFVDADTTGNNNFPDSGKGLDAVMPTIGKARPLVILIDFPDQHRPRHVMAEGVENALFSLDEPDSLSAYYYRSSYGKLTIEGSVYGWYRTKLQRNAYASDSEIMSEAIDYYINNEGLKLSDFDADNDGIVDSLYVLWAGNMEAGTNMWDSAYRSTWRESPSKWDRKITGYIFVPGSTIWSSVPPLICNTNSLVHETGHLLGLNDYYSYDTAEHRLNDGTVYTGGALEGGLGGMDMMDTNIGDHNVFSKWLLGWANPTVIEYEDLASLDENKTYRIKPSAMTGDALFIKVKTSDSLYTELFVIEAVSPILNFAEYSRLKESVVRVLHIENSLDEENLTGNWRGFGFKYDNSYTSTKYISIVEKDGKDDVLNFVPSKEGNKISYETTDYFVAGDKLTPNTYPNTNAYDACGNASIVTGLCIYIDDIEEDGTAVIRLGYSKVDNSLKLKRVTPQPQIVPYTEGNQKTIKADNAVIKFEFDKELAWSDDKSLEQIKVYNDQQLVEDVKIKLDGNTLSLSFGSALDADKSYTVVIPANILSAKNASDYKNNFNGIYGFITSK